MSEILHRQRFYANTKMLKRLDLLFNYKMDFYEQRMIIKKKVKVTLQSEIKERCYFMQECNELLLAYSLFSLFIFRLF